MSSRTKRIHDEMRERGYQDCLTGKPIDSFESLPCPRPYRQLTELMRSSYEIGWRSAKAMSATARALAVCSLARSSKARKSRAAVRS